MTGEQWDIVMQVNKVMSGYTMTEMPGTKSSRSDKEISKARLPGKEENLSKDLKDPLLKLPAFTLKPSSLSDYVIPVKVEEKKKVGKTVNAGKGKGGGKDPKEPTPVKPDTKTETLPKPEFEVHDASTINITEATDQLTWSLAKNGFSSGSVQSAR